MDRNQVAYAGADIGGTAIKLGLVSDQGKVLARDRIPVHQLPDYSSLLDAISTTIGNMVENTNCLCTGLGIGTPGRVDADQGRVIWLGGKLEYTQGRFLGPDLAERLGMPVFCDNDVNSILLGEFEFGAARGFRHVVGLAVGTGIGGAVIIDGKMYRGANYAAGHFGFMSQNPNGEEHVSGNRGATEIRASHGGLLARLKTHLAAGEESSLTQRQLVAGAGFGFKEILEEALRGDKLAQKLVNDLKCELSTLIANLVFAFDPELVLLGGGPLTGSGELVEEVIAKAKERIGILEADAINIRPMALARDAGIFGGAALAREGSRKSPQ